MIQQEFAEKVLTLVRADPFITGLAAAGSWINGEMDEFSDLDLVLVTAKKIGGQPEKMMAFAGKLENLVCAFTGEHVGEPRLLICLFDKPLLHVDLKFLTLEEFETRVEDPVILFERDQKLSDVIRNYPSKWPEPSLQWIEDRFWTWVHYIAGKIGRGEYFEALSNLDYLRMHVLSPLMQLKNGKKPRGLRKIETGLPAADLENLKITVATYDKRSLIKALDNAVSIYRSLRRKMEGADFRHNELAEKRSLDYFRQLRKQVL